LRRDRKGVRSPYSFEARKGARSISPLQAKPAFHFFQRNARRVPLQTLDGYLVVLFGFDESNNCRGRAVLFGPATSICDSLKAILKASWEL
jgi:hypothetical protein